MSDRTAEILKKVRRIELKTRGLSSQLFSGEYHSAFKGRGMAFSEVREYTAGDDIRSIDWNVTARTGEPYIKKFANFRQFRDRDVLEIGVGFGCDHSEIANQKPRSLTGIDLTERSVNNSKLRFKTLGLKSLLKIDNAENLSFKNETFDCVYSWGVLHHSPDTKKCFDEVYRAALQFGMGPDN